VSEKNGSAEAMTTGSGAISKASAGRGGAADINNEGDNSNATAIADTGGAAEADVASAAEGSTVKATALKKGAAQAFCGVTTHCMETVKALHGAAAQGSDTGSNKAVCDRGKHGTAKVTGTGGNCHAP